MRGGIHVYMNIEHVSTRNKNKKPFLFFNQQRTFSKWAKIISKIIIKKSAHTQTETSNLSKRKKKCKFVDSKYLLGEQKYKISQFNYFFFYYFKFTNTVLASFQFIPITLLIFLFSLIVYFCFIFFSDRKKKRKNDTKI